MWRCGADLHNRMLEQAAHSDVGTHPDYSSAVGRFACQLSWCCERRCFHPLYIPKITYEKKT